MPPKASIMRKDFDYQHTFLEGILFLFSEAREDGCLHEYEDLIDTIWAFIPSKHKKTTMVYDSELKGERPAFEEWAKALKMGPPPGSLELQRDPKLRVEVRSRCLRKLQIVSDIAEQLKLLLRTTAFEEMGEESDVMMELMGNDGQIR